VKNTIIRVSIALFTIVLIVTLVIKMPYYKAIRDDMFPSTSKNVTMQAIANLEEVSISYRWTGFKEFYTYTDYIIIRYNPRNVEFIYDGIVGSEDFYKLDNYLHGSIPAILSESPEKEIVIPIDRSSRNGEILVPIKNQDNKIEGVIAFYAHIVMLPMDRPTGWISEKIKIAD
jgi:hypothetical protein